MIQHHFSNLVLSSGGQYAFSFIGCLKLLEEMDILPSINTFVGCSGGALICGLYLLGYSTKEMYNYYTSNIGSKEITNISIHSFVNIFEEYGLDNGETFKEIIKKIITNKGFDENITLIDIVKKTGKNLIICVSNMTTSNPEYISIENHPDIPLVTALCMSCCIPVLFKPIKYKDNYYLDGAVIDQFPYQLCELKQLNSKDTLCIAIQLDKPLFNVENNNFIDYLIHILNVYKYYNFKCPKDDNCYNYISIIFPHEKKGSINMQSLTNEMLDDYISKGYITLKNKLTKVYNEK